MPEEVAKQIAIDLVSGDSARMILPFVQQELEFTKRKLSLKDSVIYNDQVYQANLKEQIVNEKKKSDDFHKMYTICSDQYTSLSRQNKFLRFKSRLASILGIAIVGSLTTLYLTK